MALESNEQEDADRWVTGVHLGLQVPGDLDALLAGGADYLTEAFRASGALADDNSVSRIVGWEEFDAGGTGKKAVLTVAYESPAPDLPEELFIKFSRNFDNELWDSARYLMISEVHLALLTRAPDFPVPVPKLMYADVEPTSGTGVLITECISYGRNGVEPRYFKCMDYVVPDQVDHYKAILRGLARLSGAHKGGRLSADFDNEFPSDPRRSPASFNAQIPAETVLRRATRLLDFVEAYPRLFPANVRTLEFREQFMRDIPDVLAADDKITGILKGNPDFFAFAHWNANIDNCWFDRGPDGLRRAGFLDWPNAGHLSIAQSITGAISGAENFVWDEHLDELLSMFIEEYTANGGPRIDLEELRLHVLLGTASGMAHSMGAPIAIGREIDDPGQLADYRDPWFVEHENTRIQLHMTTRLLHVWETRKIGDLVRSL